MTDTTRVHPFLATLALRRTGKDSELPGYYSSIKDVWVVDSPDGAIPLVTSSDSGLFSPVTKIDRERDRLLELSTKTRQQLERDDISPRETMLAEMVTKTEARPERDDPSPRLFELLEFSTKTAEIRERDD